ncbi:plasmid replication initiator TrfA [Desulfobulbus sp.]|uniref:plasmid replication initiator TrfA n=1 Tax=Desulfobulbus sp. TaxID=895 RepID=UPI0027BA5270|nr:plasmid replication initiator TrfA [Desulfobulbus sp.]
MRQKIQALEQIPLLPDWPEKTRGIPNICLRSALFAVIKRGRRRAVKNELIASLKGVTIQYTGWRLDQGDFDVLAQALHFQAREPDPKKRQFLRIKVKPFLAAIGRQGGKSGREWLKDSLRRLTATAVEIKVDLNHGVHQGSFSYAGSLVDEFYFSDEAQSYIIKINTKLAGLFDVGWTQVQWQQRLQLRTDLAKWLHGFYASHRSPFPVKVATLKHLCGSECARLVDFRRGLRLAMDELIEVGAILGWRIDQDDKLTLVRLSQIPMK